MTQAPIEFLYLTQEDVRSAGLSMQMTLDIVENVFTLHDQGKTNMPHKTVLDLGERERGRVNAMPAYVGGDVDVCGIKWISGFPNNPREHNLPRGIGLLIINDAWTGVPLAIMDATLISAMRTGAATGVGAKYLARQDSKKVALIGAGVQAYTQLEALHATLPNLSLALAYDIHKETAQAFAQEMTTKLDMDVQAVDSAQEAVEDADVIVTVTVADEPIVKDAWVKSGSLFSHVGSYQEEEEAVVENSDILVVDDWEAVLHRETPILAKMFLAGELSRTDIHANIGEIILGKKNGRQTDTERIFYAPIGMGSEDVAVGREIYLLAKEKGLGQTLSLFG
ncbi:MAG: ornithine cyclodeaminase [Chloroflexi bacterium]|nr:ornithine cyclodeaminase [Chloroflexota bacterium]